MIYVSIFQLDERSLLVHSMFAFEILTALLRLLVFWDNLSAQTEAPKRSFSVPCPFLVI